MKEKELTLNEYQRRAMTTCLENCENDMYMMFMLVEEIGELFGKVSKAIRKGYCEIECNEIELYGYHSHMEFKDEIKSFFDQLKGEAGDILWGLAGLCNQFGWSLEEVAQYNLDKLAKRKEQGTIVNHTDH